MRLMQQKGKYCMVYALAMCLDADPILLMRQMQYDPDEKFFESGMRSPHIQECVDVCLWTYKKALIEIEPMPQMGDDSGEVKPIVDEVRSISRLIAYMSTYDGMIHTYINGKRHMCAWCKEKQMVHDPCGKIYHLDSIDMIMFYALI